MECQTHTCPPQRAFGSAIASPSPSPGSALCPWGHLSHWAPSPGSALCPWGHHRLGSVCLPHLAAFSASPCPACHHVPPALVCDKAHSQGQCCGEHWVPVALLLPLLRAPDCQILPMWAGKGLSWKAAIQMCCSQHPAVDSSAISFTSPWPADSWSILEQGCAQSHLLLLGLGV